MQMPEPQVQRKGCSSCKGNEEDEDKILQAKSKDGYGSAQFDHSLLQNVLSSPGQPLDTATRNYMEPRFGQDFSKVRVHTDGHAVESARAVNAQAYTVGQNVIFGAGQYAPGSSEGRRLMAHELVHVGQQVGTNRMRFYQSGDKRGLSTNSHESRCSDKRGLFPPSLRIGSSSVRISRKENEDRCNPEQLAAVVLPYNHSDKTPYLVDKIPYLVVSSGDDPRGRRIRLKEGTIVKVVSRKGSWCFVIVLSGSHAQIRGGIRSRFLSNIHAAEQPVPSDRPLESSKPNTVENNDKSKNNSGDLEVSKCFSGEEDVCGEFDDASGAATLEGRKFVRDVMPKGRLRDFLEKDWEIRFLQKGTCCHYITFRLKSDKSEGTWRDQYKWEFTPIRGEIRYRKNSCTGKARCSGQISGEGVLRIFPTVNLESRFKNLGWKSQVIPLITINFVLGSNLYAAPPGSENIVRMRFFITLRGDIRWDIPGGNLRLRYGASCPFANLELGKSSVFDFTWEQCYTKLLEKLPNAIDIEQN
jgi:hypothetical protein